MFTLYLISALVLLIAAVVIFRILFWRDNEQKGRLSSLSIFLGTVLWCCWGGLAIIILGIAQLGLLRALGQEQNVLKQSGFYRFSRNPMIMGCALYGIGFAVLWPSWYALGWLLLFAVLAHLMVTTEERHLQNRFGDAYTKYCKGVPRYFW